MLKNFSMKLKKPVFIYLILIITLLFMCSCCLIDKKSPNKITFLLDWTPNTNHTGIYVAKELGFFSDEGLIVDIQQPPEDASIELVALGKADFGVSFQDSFICSKAANSKLPLITVAAILQHNTSGIISKKGSEIYRPRDLENKYYALWGGVFEESILKYVVEKDGGDYKKLRVLPSPITDVISGFRGNVDALWVYYAWDGVLAEANGINTNFFAFKDIDPVLDFYTPIIVANQDYVRENPEPTRKFLSSLSKGYEYAVKNPEESANILLKSVPGLDRKITVKSQIWISKQYKAESENWGIMDLGRWDGFNRWLYENEQIRRKLASGEGMTNEYLPVKAY